ncbi:acyl-ACP desaturase [Streptomyces diastatochromogenes]|uniref:Acyl-ACP desaturase n=1 Tax=Streptomyces diastatochromogenes TaxID=42236 RepID=A0A233RRT3_STRDA|nr:acyl-ACP desaturase [Streptomyces diastatochromogenes]MCZ0984574.1 acyl-ACP desaturase [Streptomyces diastatochromogenes]OXY86117.1 acyl-ACP desaturase [Streptomyces diastatochromogenes]
MPTRADVLVELEASVTKYLDRHLTAAREWFPHQYVPWSRGRDFDGPLNGEHWRPEDSRLSPAARDALLVNLLTEDNLPSYHREIAVRWGRDGVWGTWLHRWTAEESRHAEVLRAYLHTSRAVDPVELERARMRHVGQGYSSDLASNLHSLAYVMVQELATRVAHRNAGSVCGDPVAEQIMTRIAADENLHMIFYRDLLSDAFEFTPDATVEALADVLCSFRMPGHGIPGFHVRAARIAAAGIYDTRIHHDHVVMPLLRFLNVMNRTGLGAKGEQARDRIGVHLEDLLHQARRLDRLRPRLLLQGEGPA